MTTRQLKALANLPAVLDALAALANDSAQLRSLLLMAGIGRGPASQEQTPSRPSQPQAQPNGEHKFPAVAPGSAVLATPERAEHEAQKREPPPKRLDEKRQERLAFLKSLKLDAGRGGLMEQFAKPRNGAAPQEVIREEDVSTMPTATEDPDNG